MSAQLSIGIGIVVDVTNTEIKFQFKNSLDNQTFRTSIPHPYAGRGGGVLVGIEKDSRILVSKGPGDKWYCVGVVPDTAFFEDLDGAFDINTYESPYPQVKSGEVCLKSNKNSQVYLDQSGNVRIDAGAGLSSADFELSRLSKTMFSRIDNKCEFTEGGRSVYGVVKREKVQEENSDDSSTINFLDSESYEKVLKTIARHPKEDHHNITGKSIKQFVRNPPLIEKREILYEYANSYNVQDFENEVNSLNLDGDITRLSKDMSERANRRTDVLNLNLLNFNHLIERVEGTLVDFYGNVLDINRNIINIPPTDDLSLNGNDTFGLKKVYDHHRRAIKLHYEINSRKPIEDSEPKSKDKNENNARSFSRWSIDVDGEGLTKINIPSSSETGNIPVLSRYFTSRDETDNDTKKSGKYRDEKRRDISSLQFGTQFTSIENSDYRPVSSDGSNIESIGTAFHNMSETAKSVFSNKLSSTIKSSSPVSSSVSNKIGGSAEAGGRSLHLNLDGSMEMSVGADTVDKKSCLIDTQGSVISRYGKDKNGRSIVHQSDGDVIIQIGSGKVDVKDTRFQGIETETPGRLEIHVMRSSGGTPHKIVVDEQGLTFDIQGNMMLTSSGDMGLYSKGRLLLGGELIFLYGKVEQRNIAAFETLMIRAGIPQFM